MADLVKQILTKPIQLADQVIKLADEASNSKQECAELKSKIVRLVDLLRQTARASCDLYERPTRRIIEDTEQVLEKAHALVLKCRSNGFKSVFTIIPTASFRKMSVQLDNSIVDVSWLLRISAPAEDRADDNFGMPPIAQNEPILGMIWVQIANLYTGSLDSRSDAAATLVSLARDNDRYVKLIIEEEGVGPLLKLVKDGKPEGQENAARAIGLLGKDPENVEHMIHAGVCSIFAKVLKEGPMKVQAVVAWAVSELAGNYPPCRDLFAQNNIIRLLVSHLAFETVQEHSKYAIVSKATSIHALVLASNNTSVKDGSSGSGKGVLDEDGKLLVKYPLGDGHPNQMVDVVASTMAKRTPQNNGKQKQNSVNQHTNILHQHQSSSMNGSGIKGRESEDTATKITMKAMAARALWHLAIDNSPICHSITESKALLCFAVLLEKGTEDVQYNSAMALMEITAVAEKDTDLRRSAFKPNTPACKAVVDQLLNIIEKGESELLIPCMIAIGNLARTFKATETRMILPLVKLLEDREADISREATIALSKFVCNENYLRVDHSKAILSAEGAKHLVQLSYFGEHLVQIPALILLSYISLNVPDNEQLTKSEVLIVLDWALKQQVMAQNQVLEKLLPEAKSKMELYQSRGSRIH